MPRKVEQNFRLVIYSTAALTLLIFCAIAAYNLSLSLSLFGLGLLTWFIGSGIMYRGDISSQELIAKYGDEGSRFMDIDGMKVHYQIDGDGEPLVLIHGTIGSTDEWSCWTSELCDKYRVIRMDIPGFGLTGPNQENRYTSKEYVDFIYKFTSRLGLERFHIGGNSLGGHVAWSFAAAFPDHIQSLILVGPSGLPPGPNIWSIELAKTPILSRLMEKCTPQFFFRVALHQAYGSPQHVTPKLVKRHYELTRRQGNRQALVSHFRTVRTDNNSSDLRRIVAPTLIIWGKEDKIINFNLHTIFEREIQNVTIKAFEDIGHMVIKEVPTESAAEAHKFLSNNSLNTSNRHAA